METELSGNELRKAEKRKEIVAGAIEAFQQEGYERASMDLVAKLAGASKRTVYNHFESKKDLLWAVIGELMAGQQEMKQITYSAEDSLESQLGRFVALGVDDIGHGAWFFPVFDVFGVCSPGAGSGPRDRNFDLRIHLYAIKSQPS